MQKIILLAFILSSTVGRSFAQPDRLHCTVMDEEGQPVEFATVALLRPADSTLAYFGITNVSGIAELRNVTEGNYLLQASLIGYKTWYQHITIPVPNNNLGLIVLDKRSTEMNEVVVKGERIPIQIKKDTVEYDAAAFKTRPDASVEELLQKLPGVEVDRAGNIKAQGERVNKVYVDGKEFFGNDPTVATHNLPADAIRKVQVFDKKSERAEFTGIDDGVRERAINLTLNADKKQGYFGDVTAGAGSNDRYKASGRLYRFRPQTQFAALGMYNNVNRTGFSLGDYLNFSGGLQSLMSGGNRLLEIANAENMPVDFGMPVTGIVASGAGGLNYSYERKRNQRIALSYLGNGVDKRMRETTWAKNHTQNQSFIQKGSSVQSKNNITHRLNLELRNDMDSLHQVTFYAGVELSNNMYSDRDSSTAFVEHQRINSQSGNTYQTAHTLTGRSGGNLTRRSASGKDVFSGGGSVTYQQNLQTDDWNNLTTISTVNETFPTEMSREDRAKSINYESRVAWTHALGKGYFSEAKISAGSDNALLRRNQGIAPDEAVSIDSLSANYRTNYNYMRPGIILQKGTRRVQYNIGLYYEQGWQKQSLESSVKAERYQYLLPTFDWRNEYAKGKHLSMSYNTVVQAPNYNQLLSVPVIISPLSITVGKSALQPEYRHTARASWSFYDQFSFTSLFIGLRGVYTHNKINRTITVDERLAQYSSLTNMPDDYSGGLNVSFDRPIASAIKIKMSAEERINKGYTMVNGATNTTTSLTHAWTLGVENRKKDRWDVAIGGMFTLTNARYSLHQSLSNQYFNTGGYSSISYRPNDNWHVLLAADITVYNARSFENSVVVPLLRSEISYYFLPGKRGVLMLEGFDLLNGNKHIQRISQQNYLAEIQSDIIGRYALISFKYRLNKAGKKQPGMLGDFDFNMRK